MNKKALLFVEGLKPSFFETFGFPTIKFYGRYAEVCFKGEIVIRDFNYKLPDFDEFRMYASDNKLVIVFTFYNK